MRKCLFKMIREVSVGRRGKGGVFLFFFFFSFFFLFFELMKIVNPFFASFLIFFSIRNLIRLSMVICPI